ncbi:protein trichome birefringence-like 19 [Andrographis paniculata]|uniref:protein trichome birefringence-like 19 n=1 Tax=Andrographis paniculata TaxID=175694 RepID=UPI0021E72C13|nr:protein trichome birefringence-like 19 [Andrographis paniculata]
MGNQISNCTCRSMEKIRSNQTRIIKNITILIVIAFILLILLVHIDHQPNYNFLKTSSSSSAALTYADSTAAKCDIFTGEWVPDARAPYYTNRSCRAIHEHQNCIKYGRPDSEFMKWRWKPDKCDLPAFDPHRFLEVVRGKTMAFIGDSVGRNQMQSLICLLSKVEYPNDVSSSPTHEEHFKRLIYLNYNFTLVFRWSPFLVRSEERRDTDGPTNTGLFNLYLDEADKAWTTQIDGYDYIILNAAHWFTRTAVYYENRRLIGCRYCQFPNITDLPITYGLRRAFRAAFRAINGKKNFRGVTFLRTFAPSHFENGLWNAGGNCLRRRPFRSEEINLEGMNLDLYMIQLEEFRAAQRFGERKFRLLDITPAMLLRPDGHPSRYGHLPDENVTLYNDCVHWCLPGPIDSWADFLLHMLRMEAQ